MKKLLSIGVLLLSGCGTYSIEKAEVAKAYCEQYGATFVAVRNGEGYVKDMFCSKEGMKYDIPTYVLGRERMEIR